MDVAAWIRDTTLSAASPRRCSHQGHLPATNQQHSPRHPTLMRRLSGDSSLLDAAPTCETRVSSREGAPLAFEGFNSKRPADAYIDGVPTDGRNHIDKTFEKQARRKTRANVYDPHSDRRRRRSGQSRAQGKKKRRPRSSIDGTEVKRQKKERKLSGTFESSDESAAPNASHEQRLTVRRPFQSATWGCRQQHSSRNRQRSASSQRVAPRFLPEVGEDVGGILQAGRDTC